MGDGFEPPASSSRLARGIVGLLSRKRPGNGTTRLYRVLSTIQDTMQRRSCLEDMLGVLDGSKPALYEFFRKHLKSPLEAKALALKILNLCLAKYHFHCRSTVLSSRPFGLVVDPSNACNLACPGCVHSQHAKELELFDWKPGNLSESRVAGFLKCYGPAAIHVTLCNYGEPLVNPNTPRFIKLAKSYLMQTLISTNLALPRFDAEAYAASGLDCMVVSIDGATQVVYEQFRRKGNLELVYENARKLVDAKRRLGKSAPILAWRYLAFEHNVHEIPVAIEKAREIGVDQFKAAPAWDVSWDDPAIRPASIEPLNIEFRDTHAAIIENWNPFPGSLDAPAIVDAFDERWTDRIVEHAPAGTPERGSTCEWLYKSITMDAGGRIFPCCCAPRPDADLTFAQFHGSTASESYNSEKHTMARLSFADPKAYQTKRRAGSDSDPYCVKCEWNKVADPDGAMIRTYFRAATRDLLDTGTLDLLSAW